MGTKLKRAGGGIELETDEELASENTLNEVRKLLNDPNAPANKTETGWMTADEETVSIELPAGCSTVGLQLRGTWAGTIEFEGSVDGVNYQSVEASTGSAAATSTTSNNIFILPRAGYSRIRVRISTYTSGSVGVIFIATSGVMSGIITNPIPVGTNSIGTVGIDAGTSLIGSTMGVLKEVRLTKELEAASGYTANDVLSESDTNTAGTDWDFDVARVAAGYCIIGTALVISETTSITPRLTLFLFNAPPTSELDDNAVNTAPRTADLAKYIGRIDFPAMDSMGTVNSNAIVTPSTVGNIPLYFKCATGSTTIYGILATRDDFTQGAAKDMTVVLVVEQF